MDIPPSTADIAQREGRMGRTGQECESIFLISSPHEEKLVKDYLRKLEQARSLEAESTGGRIYLDIDGIIPKIIRCMAEMKDRRRGRECERLTKLLKQLFGKAKRRLRPSIYGRLIHDGQPELWRVKVLGESKTELNERQIRLYDVVIRYQKNFIHSPSRSRKYVVKGFERDDKGRWLVLLERYIGDADVATTLFDDSFMTPPSLDQYFDTGQCGGRPLQSQLFLVERRPIMIKQYQVISSKEAAHPLKKVDEFDLTGEEHHVYRDLYEGFYFKLYFPRGLNYSLLYQACHYALHILLNRLAEELNVRYSEFFDFVRIPSPEGIAAIEDLLNSQVKEAEVIICDQSGLLANNILRLHDVCERTIREFDPRFLTPLCESYNCPVRPLIGETLSQDIWSAIYAVLNTLCKELESRLGLVRR